MRKTRQDKITKSVEFNRSESDDLTKLLKKVDRSFSSYVRNLVKKDIKEKLEVDG